MAFEAPQLTDDKPNTWGWATNLVEKVRRSKFAQRLGRFAIDRYEPPQQEIAPFEPDTLYPGWDKDPHEDRYYDDTYIPPGHSVMTGPTRIESIPSERFTVNEGGTSRFETGDELQARMNRFNHDHPTASVMERHQFEVT